MYVGCGGTVYLEYNNYNALFQWKQSHLSNNFLYKY